jgi:hypothetical protein
MRATFVVMRPTGSPVGEKPLLRCRYHEWYTRALVHGWTHVEVADNDTMCEDVYAKVLRCTT